MAVAAGYVAGFGGGAAVSRIQDAGAVIGNAMVKKAGEDCFGGGSTLEPLAAKRRLWKPTNLNLKSRCHLVSWAEKA